MRNYIVIINSVILASCAIRPLPENVTALNTYAIVTKIRCEAKDAIYQELLSFLKEKEYGVSPEIIAEVEKDPSVIAGFDRTRLPAKIREKVNLYGSAAIVYDFNFNIAQQNTTGVGATLNDTWSTGLLNLGFSGKNERKRRNQRLFRVSDTFYELFTQPPSCELYSTAGASPKFIKTPDFAYPITGYLGLQEIINTFWKLNENASLTASGDKPNLHKLADEIEFTTKNSSSFTPGSTLNPNDHLKITAVNGESSHWREDVHTVTIGIALEDAVVTEVTTVKTTSGRPRRVRTRVTGGPASAVKNANDAINELKFNNQYIINSNDLNGLIPTR